MTRIALIGESPNDTYAIKNLLAQKYAEGFHFYPLLNNIKGSHLDSPKAVAAFQREIRLSSPHFVIVIRDSDGHGDDAITKTRKEWFNKLARNVDRKCILLLNIHALEALVLADPNSFAKYYNIDFRYDKNVMHQVNPKKVLKDATAKYKKEYREIDCKNLFGQLKFDIVKKNCSYFNSFVADFEAAVLPLP